MPHYLDGIIKGVNRTHKHLGELTAMSMLALKSHQLLLTISPHGCGKSRITQWVGGSYPKNMFFDRISTSGLTHIASEMSGFDGALVIDDISKTGSVYARISTICTLAELIYSHYIKSIMNGSVYEIQDFYGSAIVNIQPVILRELVMSDEWEGSIQDKSIRFYHLYRPLKPCHTDPEVKLRWGADFEAVMPHKISGKLGSQLMDIGLIQWSTARAESHITDLLKACAALDNRMSVDQTDYKILLKILNPLRIEGLVSSKRQFESDRFLDSGLLATLTEYLTFGNFTLENLSLDFKIPKSSAYKLMSNMSYMWNEVSKTPTTYAPNNALRAELIRMRLIKQ